MLKSVVYLKTNGGAPVLVNPVYGTDVELSREREANKHYFRDILNGSFTFIGEEFATLYNGSIDNEYTLQVKLRNTVTGVETLFGEAIFHKIDCTFNVADSKCTVKLSTWDRYNKLLAGLSNEYNLVNLAPERKAVTIAKRPVLQLYMLGDNKITGVIGNSSYEVDSVVVIDSGTATTELARMQFGLLHRRAQFLVEITDPDYEPYFPQGALGYYYGVYTTGNHRFTNDNGYYFTISGSPVQVQIFSPSDTPVSNVYLEYDNLLYPSDLDSLDLVSRATPESAGVIRGHALVNRRFIYGRFLSDNENLGDARRIPGDDICEENLNYRYAFPADEVEGESVAPMITWNRATSETPTKWGKSNNDLYFAPPAPVYPQDIIVPIGWSTWIPEAFWFESRADFYSDPTLISETQIADNYPIESAIKVLLKAIGVENEVSFEGTTDYSEFLFGTSVPISNPQSPSFHISQRLLITPITHIKKTYYNQAAQRGNIKLSDIFDMLEKCFQCYWFIDDTGKLRIEHISWFKNGGSYNSDSRTVLVNLTQNNAPRNFKPWSFAQKTFNYDKSGLRNRYEFGYNEETTAPFNGYALDVKNAFCQSGSKEETKVSNFISDLDFVISTPSSVSDDCFALIGADPTTFRVPIATIRFASGLTEFTLQNPYLSFLYLETTYWGHNLSGNLLYSQDWETYLYGVRGTKRLRTQEGVVFPCSIDTAYSQGLITTELGNGEIKKISLNLSSLMATTTLEYDTE